MRIIAGNMRGHHLHVPRNAAFRPTTDRVREALFNILGGMLDWEGCELCDLFAGSGSLGIEALSRGASSVTFVEQSRTSREVLERNLRDLNIEDRCRILPLAVQRFCPNAGSFDLILADPPYRYEEYNALLDCCARLLRTEGLAVIEHDARTTLDASPRLRHVDRREYGATAITIFRLTPGAAP